MVNGKWRMGFILGIQDKEFKIQDTGFLIDDSTFSIHDYQYEFPAIANCLLPISNY